MLQAFVGPDQKALLKYGLEKIKLIELGPTLAAS